MYVLSLKFGNILSLACQNQEKYFLHLKKCWGKLPIYCAYVNDWTKFSEAVFWALPVSVADGSSP